MMHGSLDQSIYSYKSNLKNPKFLYQNPIINSNPSQSQFSSTGLLQPPPPPSPPPFLSQSYPPYSQHRSSQPPLLPLPAAARGNPNIMRELSLTSNKSKSKPKSRSPKKEDKKSPKKSKNGARVAPLMSSVILNSDSRKSANGGNLRPAVDFAPVDVFSGSAAFTTISPPPSSLPIPTFSLRPRLGCRAEAGGGVDAGATNDLRRLLRLR